jgi:hypothetical protein
MERPPFNWKVSKWERNKRDFGKSLLALSASQPNERQSVLAQSLFKISARHGCEKVPKRAGVINNSRGYIVRIVREVDPLSSRAIGDTSDSKIVYTCIRLLFLFSATDWKAQCITKRILMSGSRYPVSTQSRIK